MALRKKEEAAVEENPEVKETEIPETTGDAAADLKARAEAQAAAKVKKDEAAAKKKAAKRKVTRKKK